MERTVNIEDGFDGHGYVIPAGPVGIVCVVCEYGVAACGLVDINVYDRFGVPAVCAKKETGLICSPEELLESPVVKVNSCAACLGIKPGKSAAKTLARMRQLVIKSRKNG